MRRDWFYNEITLEEPNQMNYTIDNFSINKGTDSAKTETIAKAQSLIRCKDDSRFFNFWSQSWEKTKRINWDLNVKQAFGTLNEKFQRHIHVYERWCANHIFLLIHWCPYFCLWYFVWKSEAITCNIDLKHFTCIWKQAPDDTFVLKLEGLAWISVLSHRLKIKEALCQLTMRKEILKNQFPATSLEKKHLQRRLGNECVKNLKKSRL